MAANKDKLLQAIEAVHAAGLDDELWPQALGAAAGLVRANVATLEAIETPSFQHLGFRGFNVPPANELLYVREYVPLSPRIPFAARHRAGDFIWDYKFLNEAAMDRDPFYQGFLKEVDLRYFVCGLIESGANGFTGVSVHRPRKQGHFGRREVGVLRRLLPHFRQAYGVTQRLREARGRVNAFQSALDWLADGVALLAADGTVLYANESLEEIARRGDGIRIARRTVRLSAPSAASHLAAALGTVARLRAGDSKAAIMHDFSVARPANAPPYLLCLRPVTHGDAGRLTRRTPVALLFVHDPLQHHRRAAQIFREALGLTEAEANLALALQEGTGVADYARLHALSPNTAYTHLRRIKEKTGCKHMGELICWLNDLRLPLRRDK